MIWCVPHQLCDRGKKTSTSWWIWVNNMQKLNIMFYKLIFFFTRAISIRLMSIKIRHIFESIVSNFFCFIILYDLIGRDCCPLQYLLEIVPTPSPYLIWCHFHYYLFNKQSLLFLTTILTEIEPFSGRIRKKERIILDLFWNSI